ncbi:MAG: hypothetical protein KF767_03135 [Bdellovibrionaceae bacterium]|nr:hypothetical protein [Pseudobdellovibrionaceae bacterium]
MKVRRSLLASAADRDSGKTTRGKDTRSEPLVRRGLHRSGFKFRKHVRGLPSTPDAIMVSRTRIVFIDGDFWHGGRFGTWKHQLNKFWRTKIQTNIQSDKRNFGRLRMAGWTVIRARESYVKSDLDAALSKVESTARAD